MLFTLHSVMTAHIKSYIFQTLTYVTTPLHSFSYQLKIALIIYAMINTLVNRKRISDWTKLPILLSSTQYKLYLIEYFQATHQQEYTFPENENWYSKVEK